MSSRNSSFKLRAWQTRRCTIALTLAIALASSRSHAQTLPDANVANVQSGNASSISTLKVSINGTVDYPNFNQGSQTQAGPTTVLEQTIEYLPPDETLSFAQSLKFTASKSYGWIVFGDFQPFVREAIDPKAPGFSPSIDGKSVVRAAVYNLAITGTAQDRSVVILNGMVDSPLGYRSTTGPGTGKLQYGETGTFSTREPWVRLQVAGNDFSRSLNFHFDPPDRGLVLAYYRSAQNFSPKFLVIRLRTLESALEVVPESSEVETPIE